MDELDKKIQTDIENAAKLANKEAGSSLGDAYEQGGRFAAALKKTEEEEEEAKVGGLGCVLAGLQSYVIKNTQ
ncbi:hypothetical protein FACUT_1832 [Fusarium acutatum]|uniref:Uncharacterized protein n=1 Tax=Fusarium acutatum TaxID=78861 RepID=A0A8H4K3Q5_9HYPO|nr:hypothetical protein FACUT_1832 [Fusarium acutatum]